MYKTITILRVSCKCTWLTLLGILTMTLKLLSVREQFSHLIDQIAKIAGQVGLTTLGVMILGSGIASAVM